MAQYAPLYNDPAHNHTYTADAAITGGQLVYLSTAGTATSNGGITPTSAATTIAVGVAGHDAVAGQAVNVHADPAGIHMLVASAAIPLGPVKAAANGQIAAAVAADGEQIIGRALTTAASAGQLVRVRRIVG